MKINCKLTKTDDDKRLVFGFASVAQDADGQIVIDSEGDTVSIDELERAAYDFVSNGNGGGENHETFNVAELVESVVFTPEKLKLLGIENVPLGWFVGFRVTDDDVWQKVKDGTYTMFSIGGTANRKEVDDD